MGPFWGSQTAWSPQIRQFTPPKHTVLGRKWGFVAGPPKGPISDPRVQNPDPSESYPLRAKMTLKMDDLGTPDRRADPWSHNGHQDLHPRLVFASHCFTTERTSFWVQMGPFGVAPPLGSICVKWGPKWGPVPGHPIWPYPTFGRALLGLLASPPEPIFTTG